jgi:Bacterial toxin 33
MMGGGSGPSGTGNAIVVSVPSGSGGTSDDSGNYSISTPDAINDPTVQDDASTLIDSSIPDNPTTPIATSTPTYNAPITLPDDDGNSSGTGNAIVVSVPSGSGGNTSTNGSGSLGSPAGVSNPGTTTGGLGTSINPAAIPPNLFISDSNPSRSNQQNVADNNSEDSDSEDDSSPEATRQRILTFLEAQQLAGERWTAKAISEKLDIPIGIAQIAVLNPIGRNIKVPEPDIAALYGGTLVAGDIDGGNGIFPDDLGLFKVVIGGIVVAAGITVNAAIDLWNHFFPSKDKEVASDDPSDRDGKQDRQLSPNEIERLKNGGVDVHELRGGKNASKRDLYKDKKGDIYVKRKGGKGAGEPTGLNINDF